MSSREARRWMSGLVGCLISAVAALANASPRPHTRWANESALTTAPGRVEAGVFSSGAWGLDDRFELSAHPLAFLVFPRADLKVRLLDGPTWHLSSLHGLGYPSLFLHLVSRSGTGGLLPPDEEAPQALLLSNDALLTAHLTSELWLTFRGGVVLGPSTHPPVVLDFPFLYPRLAALNAPLLGRAGVSASATAWRRLDVEFSSLVSLFPLPELPTAYAWESNLELGWSFSDRLRISGATRGSLARYPVGTRWHWLPVVDFRFAF